MHGSGEKGAAFTGRTWLEKRITGGLWSYRPGAVTRNEEEGLEVQLYELDTSSQIFDCDVLVSLGAPVVYATLCAMQRDIIGREDPLSFGNCSCLRHTWYLGANKPADMSQWSASGERVNEVRFLMECGELIFVLPSKIDHGTGSMEITGVFE